jgi:hypothetical protein
MSQTILIPGYLYWDGTKYVLSPGTSGIEFTANGDLAGSPLTQQVIGLQTIPVSSSIPTNGQVLSYNGLAWAPATPSGGGGSVYTTNTLVSGPTSYVIPAVSTRIMADVTSGAITLTMPAGASFTQVAVTNSAGNFSIHNCTVVASGSNMIENPSIPGTFGSSIVLNVFSKSIDWLFDSNRNRWKVV